MVYVLHIPMRVSLVLSLRRWRKDDDIVTTLKPKPSHSPCTVLHDPTAPIVSLCVVLGVAAAMGTVVVIVAVAWATATTAGAAACCVAPPGGRSGRGRCGRVLLALLLQFHHQSFDPTADLNNVARPQCPEPIHCSCQERGATRRGPSTRRSRVRCSFLPFQCAICEDTWESE